MKRINHTGWGRTHSSFSKCYELSEVNQAFFSENKNGLAIGFGRSYGDSSVTSNGIYIKLKEKKKIELNSKAMTATCSADVSIGDLERTSIKKNLFPWTVPGTEFVSIGGAIASGAGSAAGFGVFKTNFFCSPNKEVPSSFSFNLLSSPANKLSLFKACE